MQPLALCEAVECTDILHRYCGIIGGKGAPPFPKKLAHFLRGDPSFSRLDDALLLDRDGHTTDELKAKNINDPLQLIFHRLSFLFIVLVYK